jgi:5-methylcytosine-specific restriction endonuclease McrA
MKKNTENSSRPSLPRCMILNASNEFLCVRDWFRAVRLSKETYIPEEILSDPSIPKHIKACKAIPKMEVLAWYDDVFAKSEREQHRIPAVMRLKYWVKTDKKKMDGRLNSPSLRNVLVRDNFKCQYCGRGISLRTATRDHVHPLSKGGPNTLDNIVASCKPCNNLKDSMSLREFENKYNMKLSSQPRMLTEEEKLQAVLKGFKSRERKTWLNCLHHNGIELW